MKTANCAHTVNGGAAHPEVEGRHLVVDGHPGDTIVPHAYWGTARTE